GDIRAVVDDQQGAMFAAQARDPFGGFEHIAAPMRLMADLQHGRPAVDESGGGRLERYAARLEGFRVEDGIKPRQPHRRDYPKTVFGSGLPRWAKRITPSGPMR